MKRSLLLAILAIATSLFVVSQASASVVESGVLLESGVELTDDELETEGEDMCAGCWDPPPPPPPPQPPPPPPPPPPACSDGRDNEPDGFADLGDPGCSSPSDNDEWNDWDAVWRSAGGATPQLEYEGYACGVTAAQEGKWYTYSVDSFCLSTTARCTKKVWGWRWKDVLGEYFKLRTTIEVCYRHNNGIVTVLKRYDEALSTRAPWGFVGRVSGYPLHYRYTKYVDFHFRNRLSFCIAWEGCLPEKEPWLVIRFHDTNTMTWESGTA